MISIAEKYQLFAELKSEYESEKKEPKILGQWSKIREVCVRFFVLFFKKLKKISCIWRCFLLNVWKEKMIISIFGSVEREVWKIKNVWFFIEVLKMKFRIFFCGWCFLPSEAGAFLHHWAQAIYRFSKRIMSQLQNWAFLTYLHDKPRNTYSRYQEVVVSLLNLHCYSYFSGLENFKRSLVLRNYDFCSCDVILLEKWYVGTSQVLVRMSGLSENLFVGKVLIPHGGYKWWALEFFWRRGGCSIS